MFLPKSLDGNAKKEEEIRKKREIEIKEACSKIEKIIYDSIPKELQEGVDVNVSEVVCGDPNCAPIDTCILIQYESGGRGMFGIPSEAKNITTEDIQVYFPTKEVLEKWSRGEEAQWPVFDDDSSEEAELDLPKLRFDVGDRVQCRISPDPVRGWVGGVVTMLWYREASWPLESYAPYKVLLDDGRKIFAPADTDRIIRLFDENIA